METITQTPTSKKTPRADYLYNYQMELVRKLRDGYVLVASMSRWGARTFRLLTPERYPERVYRSSSIETLVSYGVLYRDGSYWKLTPKFADLNAKTRIR